MSVFKELPIRWSILSILLFVLNASTLADTLADTRMPVVFHYEKAKDIDWSKMGSDQIPDDLIEVVTVPNPSQSEHSQGGVFLQNDRIKVCGKTCETQGDFQITQSGSTFILMPTTRFCSSVQASRTALLKHATVYYWSC